MSTTALTWAFGQKTGSPTTKAVLVALADQAADEDYTCYPGQELIATRTELGVRTVRRSIKELEDLGFLRRTMRHTKDGRRTSDHYTLAVDVEVKVHQPKRPERPPATAATGQTVQSPPATDDSSTGHSGQVTVSEPSVEPSVRPSSSSSADAEAAIETNTATAKSLGAVSAAVAREQDKLFEQFWEVYPRRASKGGARAKFTTALRRAPFDAILSGAERYRDDPHREDAFTKHPTTWLANDCWADPPLPERRSERPEHNPNPANRRPQW